MHYTFLKRLHIPFVVQPSIFFFERLEQVPWTGFGLGKKSRFLVGSLDVLKLPLIHL